MTGFDLLILAVYITCVSLVLYRAIESLDDRFSVKETQEETQDDRIRGTLNIKLGFDKRYKLDDLKKISLNVENKTTDSVFVDWDNCSLTDLGGRSRRVIRILPQMTSEIFQPQTMSVIAPTRTLREAITAEDVLKPKEGSGKFDIADPLINISKLNDKKSSDNDKKRYAQFMARQADLDFAFRLALRLPDRTSDPLYVLFKITLKKLPWTDSFPWNQK